MSANQNTVQDKELYWSATEIAFGCDECGGTPCDLCVAVPVYTDGRVLIPGTDQWFIPVAPKPPMCTVHPICVPNIEDQTYSETGSEYCESDASTVDYESDSSSGYSSEDIFSSKRKINCAEVKDVQRFAKRNGVGSRRGPGNPFMLTCLVCSSDVDDYSGKIIHYSGCPCN